MDCVKSEFDDLCITEDTNNAARMDKRKKHIDAQDDDDEDSKYISKNLNAERKRRKKLSDRQLELRSLMNKATIITDAITYIEELKQSVEDLTHQLHQMEATSVAQEKPDDFKEIDAEQETNKWGLAQPEVQVNHIGGTKFWIKIVFQKKRGGLTKLMEAINVVGFDITDTSITTSDGAVLVTLSAEGSHGGLPEADKIKKFLLEVISNI
ncbi:Transcription factor DYT1 [Sesamum alatum]|uniref:Transcription factor DYT1 n=1 Tax=Sesamum alatum TaxID=300844 RepID=A0AAE2CYG9_9LAMI|nr:Transcription factor DYT1 [Sesamum alatum]